MIPRTEKLTIPNMMKIASSLPLTGKLAISTNNLVYLDIDDQFIHQLFPLLKNEEITKPNYFGEKSAGAHITVIYPEENKSIDTSDLGKEHHFLIKSAVAAEIGQKIYYVVLVESSSLLQLRKKYHLSDLLNFKGYLIEFHITIGVKKL